jgi:hypothetical protein
MSGHDFFSYSGWSASDGGLLGANNGSLHHGFDEIHELIGQSEQEAVAHRFKQIAALIPNHSIVTKKALPVRDAEQVIRGNFI